jgi:polysaccharide biosynthesis/export protein
MKSILQLAAVLLIVFACSLVVAGQSTLASNETAPGGSKPSMKNAVTDDFLIGNEDVLSVNVWKEPEISRAVAVRSDGKISLPLIGEVVAAGKTPMQLQTEITSNLRPYIAEPSVTVIVQEIKSKRFNILGHVQHAGAFPLNPPLTVLDAIALAGGLREFAKPKSIYILRADANGAVVRLPFNYKDVVKGIHTEQNIELQPHDTIMVP